jgi:very-short-patch-repair endonuclease
MGTHKIPLADEVKERCRDFRQEPTEAERKLWAYIKNRQLCGIKFRRQHPLDRYILDFYCEDAKLCIELDGSEHLDPEQAQYDMERTQYLHDHSIRVIRFWNSDVLTNINLVLDAIVKEVNPSD